jgi:8-amino-7-oxononanoate synthase
MDAQRYDLLEKSRRFAAGLASDGWDTAGSATQIVPVIAGENADALAAAEFLQHEGFAVRAIRPPTVPEGKARLRFSLTAATPEGQLDRLRDALATWRTSECRTATAGCA